MVDVGSLKQKSKLKKERSEALMKKYAGWVTMIGLAVGYSVTERSKLNCLVAAESPTGRPTNELSVNGLASYDSRDETLSMSMVTAYKGVLTTSMMDWLVPGFVLQGLMEYKTMVGKLPGGMLLTACRVVADMVGTCEQVKTGLFVVVPMMPLKVIVDILKDDMLWCQLGMDEMMAVSRLVVLETDGVAMIGSTVDI